MSKIEQSIEVDAPVRVVYDQWTQFEEFPRFMEGVESVRQLDDTRLHWVAEVGGKRKEWDARIVEQVPDRRISWMATGGAANGGTVTFESLDASRTRITLVMEIAPEGVTENVGDALGVPDRRVKGDLERFREFLESRGSATGGWRGEVHGGQVRGERELAGTGTMGTAGYGDVDPSGTSTGTGGYGTGSGLGSTSGPGSGYGTGTGSGSGSDYGSPGDVPRRRGEDVEDV